MPCLVRDASGSTAALCICREQRLSPALVQLTVPCPGSQCSSVAEENPRFLPPSDNTLRLGHRLMNKIPRTVVIYHVSSSCNYVNFCKAQYINYILVKMIVVANLPREYLTVSIEYHEEESMVSPALSMER